MMTIHVHSEQVVDQFRHWSDQSQTRIAEAVFRTGLLLQTKVRGKASGRPGPFARTGDYRRGISVLNGTRAGIPVSVVYSSSPQAARLEYGFVGTDSLGRNYNQPPYPHWGPARREVEEYFYKAMRDAVKGVFR